MQEHYNEVVKCLNQLIRSCKDASAACQQWGYNGHKRMYQTYSLKYMEKFLYLKKKVFDMFRFMPIDNNASEPYKPTSYKEHFFHWEKFIKMCIDTLSNLSKKIYESTGMENCTLNEILHCLYKDYEKVCREIAIYNESQWHPIELHMIDAKYHKKFKKKMKERGYK